MFRPLRPSILLLSLLLGATAGAQVTFTPAAPIPSTFPVLSTSIGNRVLIAVDLDMDGDHDLVCGQDNVCTVVGCGLWVPDQPGGLLLAANPGNDTFGAAVQVSPQAWTGQDVASADIDGDGSPDIVSLGRQSGIGGAGSMVCVMLNDGAGGLGAPTITGVAPWASFLRTGDFDGDGTQDVLITGAIGSQSQAQVWLGDGTGSFSPWATRQLGTVAIDADVADFDLDGTDDSVFATGLGVTLIRWTASGPGLPVHHSVAAPATPHTVTVGQFNADAAPDVAAASSFLGVNVIALFANDGSGNLLPAPNAALPSTTTTIHTISPLDVDGDGTQEVALGFETATGPMGTVLRNSGFGFFPVHPGLPVGPQPDVTVLPDAAGSLPHLVSANRADQTISVLRNNTARIDLLGAPALATMLPLRFHSPGNPGLEYLAAFSESTAPGIPLPDGRIVPLAPSPLLIGYLTVGHPAFVGFNGLLDASGTAQGHIQIPNDPTLVGAELYLAFLVVDLASPSGIARISIPRRVAL